MVCFIQRQIAIMMTHIRLVSEFTNNNFLLVLISLICVDYAFERNGCIVSNDKYEDAFEVCSWLTHTTIKDFGLLCMSVEMSKLFNEEQIF